MDDFPNFSLDYYFLNDYSLFEDIPGESFSEIDLDKIVGNEKKLQCDKNPNLQPRISDLEAEGKNFHF